MLFQLPRCPCCLYTLYIDIFSSDIPSIDTPFSRPAADIRLSTNPFLPYKPTAKPTKPAKAVEEIMGGGRGFNSPFRGSNYKQIPCRIFLFQIICRLLRHGIDSKLYLIARYSCHFTLRKLLINYSRVHVIPLSINAEKGLTEIKRTQLRANIHIVRALVYYHCKE